VCALLSAHQLPAAVFTAVDGLPWAGTRFALDISGFRIVSARRIWVRAKKSTKRSRSVRYLLSADRRLQRLSLRKMPESAPKTKSQPRTTRTKRAGVASELWDAPSEMALRAIVLGMIGVVAAVTLIAARQDPPPVEVASVAAAVNTFVPAAEVPAKASHRQEPGAPSGKVPAQARPITKKTIVSTVPTRAIPDARSTAASTRESGKIPSERRVDAPTAKPSLDVAPTSSRLDTAVTASEPNVQPVTIAGCLDQHEDGFRLKDTSGGDAPTSRSWRSGFLKKRSKPIELVDATHKLALSSLVGQRVEATGILANGEMRARSVRRVAVSCN
jgi:hypothetical protein